MEIFSNELNYSIKQFIRKDREWGRFDKNSGQWNGMISNLLNQEADLISSCMDECCNRSDVVTFLWTLTESELVFGIKSKLNQIIGIHSTLSSMGVLGTASG